MSDTPDVSISMPWHTGDWLRETAHMLPEEKGAHADSLTAAWIHGGYLRRDRWRQQAHVDPDKWQSIETTLLDGLWVLGDDGRVHLPRLLAELERARIAKAQAVARAKHARAEQLAGSKPAPRRPQAGHPSPSPSPNPGDPTPNPKPTDPDDCAEPAADGPTPAPTEPALLVFPCAGKVKSWALTEPIRAELAEAFPAVDVLAVARRALEWLKANPRKMKTAKRMRGWLGSVWCAGEQDRGRPDLRVVTNQARDPRVGNGRAEDYQHTQTGVLSI